jgi:hypothetical protein
MHTTEHPERHGNAKETYHILSCFVGSTVVRRDGVASCWPFTANHYEMLGSRIQRTLESGLDSVRRREEEW